jgi:hypothetical protein
VNESQWLTSGDPAAMLGWVMNPSDNANPLHLYQLSDRKLRLFATACYWALHPATGKAADEDIQEGTGLAQNPLGWATRWAESKLLLPEVRVTILRDIVGNPWRPVRCRQSGNPLGTGTVMVRDSTLIGCDRAWLTRDVLHLAQQAYEERPERECRRCEGRGWNYLSSRHDARTQCLYCAKGRINDGTLDATTLAVLADALDEVGCDNGDILAHLRSPGIHVRGCWAVDLILGEE